MNHERHEVGKCHDVCKVSGGKRVERDQLDETRKMHPRAQIARETLRKLSSSFL